MKTISEKYLALIPVSLLCGYFAIKALTAPIHDFANYYFGGYFMSKGNFNADIYFPYWFNSEVALLGYQNIFGAYAPNTPFLAFAFVPFSMIPLEGAKFIFNLLGILLFLYSFLRLVSHYKIKPYYLLAIPVLFFVPIRNNIMFGQVYFVLFFLLNESWLAYEKGRVRRMSVFLAFAIMLKVFPVLLLAVFLFRKEFKHIIYVVGFSALLCIISILFCGIEVWTFWLQEVLPKASNGEIAVGFTDNYQSVFMFLKRVLIFDPIENPLPFADYPNMAFAVLFAFKLFIIMVGFYITQKEKNQLFVFSYWIFSMLVISPYGSTYTLVLLVISFFAIVKSTMTPWKKTVGYILILLISNLPISIFINSEFPISYLRMFAMLLFLGQLIAVVYPYVNWLKISLATVIPAIIILLYNYKPQPVISKQLLNAESPILIYDYKLTQDRLQYYYWDDKGSQSATIAFPSSAIISADLSQNNVYYFGKKITSDAGNKLKPVSIDGKTIIYLSDAGRGIGFYTLRVLDIDNVKP